MLLEQFQRLEREEKSEIIQRLVNVLSQQESIRKMWLQRLTNLLAWQERESRREYIVSLMKRFLEQVAEEMKTEDINLPEVMAEAQRRLEEGDTDGILPKLQNRC